MGSSMRVTVVAAASGTDSSSVPVAEASGPLPGASGFEIPDAAPGQPLPPPGETGTTAAYPAPKRRSPVACRRCRRMRCKCIHDKAQPPCKACAEAGLSAEDCEFPVRGQPDNDREFRHPRVRADRTSRRDPTRMRRELVDATGRPPAYRRVEWEHLGSINDIVDGIERFTRHYFQLGFIPKRQFPERVRHDHQSVSLFLVASILSISARLSPSLEAKYSSGIKAAEFFMDLASQMAPWEFYNTTLENCQAFYLLSIAQQGSGLRNESYMNMGVSMRMACALHLHREEKYYHSSDSSPEENIRAESARRTLWMLHSQDQLHSGPFSPVSLAASDITALLPCSEEDFAAGRIPPSRAAVADSPPAIAHPSLVNDPNRSLFASLIQVHHFWGIISRRSVSLARSSQPWDPTSDFAHVVDNLNKWENGLPQQHLWSAYNLAQYKNEGQDLAYLGVTMVPRLCNIVIRRPYMIDLLTNGSQDPQNQKFFSNLVYELFRNVQALYEQVDAQFTNRTVDESVGAQMAAFCVYSCGLFATYMYRYPQLCPDPALSGAAPAMLQRTLGILSECKQVWPLASRWMESLERFARDPEGSALTTEGSMADSKDSASNPVIVPIMTSNTTLMPASGTPASTVYNRPRGSIDTSSSSMQSPENMTPLTTTPPMHYPSNYAQPQQQLQQPQIHQQLQHSRSFQQQQQPLPQAPQHHTASMAAPISRQLSDQQFPSQLFMPTTTASAFGSGGVGILEPFESAHHAGSSAAAAMPAYCMAPNGNPAPAGLYPSADGFDHELQFYMNGQQEWTASNGVFGGYV